ncbi:MAG: cobalamin biosynthesis protein CbiA [Desulfobacterium sp.]|nr:cobalamin biosynthesis protein CbiA [Desulfobacterium sp.]MBU3948854.1 cobalamin biosynthesis protein CbiA [Pseudomonadota bacterium]MBU4037945.1 cobalamin biosynthesis protein CbiA [Pseudomonadota bacterium]
MDILLEGIVVIVGNYGSGKTEISINLAVNRKLAGIDVSIADLDLVNPYFRTREARKQLIKLGIEVVLPPEKYLQADLAILAPAVSGLIRKPRQLTILDVGGDKTGATVLAALGDAFKGRSYRLLQVINPYRPFTDTLKGCIEIKDGIEKVSGMRINGIIGNANLINETTVDTIYKGYEFVSTVSDNTGLLLEFITIPSSLSGKVDIKRFSCPVLTLKRQLVPPWIKITDL